MRDRIEDAMANGQRNQRTLELLHNWCGHVRARKQGVGLVEQMTGLPIGHMSLECPHAPAGGMSAFELSDTALDFHDRNCVDCKFRKPMGFPNISVLLAEREQRLNAQRLENERVQADAASRLAARERAREAIRSSLSPIEATTLDRIVELERQEDGAAQKLIETATLAPETFTPAIVDHLFYLIESQEYGLVGPSLETVSRLPLESARLCNAALRALRSSSHMELGGALVEAHCKNADPALIADAVPALASLANPPSFSFGPGRRSEPVIGPLRAIYFHHRDAVRSALKEMLASRRPYTVRLSALGLEALIPADPSLGSFLATEFIAKLVRSDRLLEGRNDEIEDTLNDIRKVLVAAFEANPAAIDQSIKDFLVGASDEGAAELYKIYDDVLRDARFNDNQTPVTEAHEVAFRRLIVAASEATTREVEQTTSGFFHGEPYDLAPLAAKQIDLLLGSAAVLDGKLAALRDTHLDKNDEMASLVREGRLQHLDHLSDSFVNWACLSAAKTDLAAIKSVLSFLRGLPEGSDRLLARIIRNFHAMMRTPEGLIACLPDFYSAQVGSSQLVRSHAATAMGQMRGNTHDNLPSLAFEAFCAQLADPFLIVHKAAVRALSNFTLPGAFRERAKRELIQLIVHYAKERPKDEFLIEAIDLFLRRFTDGDAQADGWAALCVEILKKATPYAVAKRLQTARKAYANAPEYPALLLSLFDDRQAMSLYRKYLVARVSELPSSVVVKEREALLALGKKHMIDHPDLIGVLIEGFSAAGLWDDAAALATAAHEGIEDTIRNTQFRLHSALRMIACNFEQAIGQDDGERVKKLGKEFHAALAAIEEDHAANRVRRDPLRGLPGTH